jgi:hypothetical protein
MQFKSDVVEYQLSNISLLQSMYPDPSELTISPHCLTSYRALEETPHASVSSEQLEIILTTSVEQGSIDLVVILPLSRSRVEINMRQPPWLTRVEWEQVRALPPSVEDDLVVEYLLETMDLIRNRVNGLEKYKEVEEDKKPDIYGESTSAAAPVKSCLQRVWFWFPSLSSKEKRRDLITFAEEHLLTGFLLAGESLWTCSVMRSSLIISRQTWTIMCRGMRERSRSIHVTYKI